MSTASTASTATCPPPPTRHRLARAARTGQRAVPRVGPLRLALRARQARARPGLPRPAGTGRPGVGAGRHCAWSTSAAARACWPACCRPATTPPRRAAGRPPGRPAPRAVHYTGIELMPKDVAARRRRPWAACRWRRASSAPTCAHRRCPTATWWSSSTCCTTWTTRRRPACWRACAAALGAQGRLLLRVGDMTRGAALPSASGSTAWSPWCAATACRRPGAAACCNGAELLQGLGFAVQAVPMSQGTPFANVLLVADRGRPGDMTPLAVSDITVVSALGHGRARHAGRAAGRPQRAAPGRLRDRRARRLAGRGRRHRRPGPGRRTWRSLRLPQQPPGRTGPAGRRLCRQRAARARSASAPAASACSWAPAPRASCRPSWPTAGATRSPVRCPPTCTTPDAQHLFGGALRAPALGLQGPAAVVSTACSSSAKVFGQAARLIELGLIDAAVVGGVDSLCLTTLYGFARRWNWCRPRSAGPGTRSARACRSARPRPLRCWSATPRRRWPGCWAAAKAATATT
jgi:hypothetical protein